MMMIQLVTFFVLFFYERRVYLLLRTLPRKLKKKKKAKVMIDTCSNYIHLSIIEKTNEQINTYNQYYEK